MSRRGTETLSVAARRLMPTLCLALALCGCGGDGVAGTGADGATAADEVATTDGTGAMGSAPGAMGGGAGGPKSFPHANLIVISLDTLRADGLGTLGGPPNISPVLDQFAADSVVFTQARAAAPHTAPSHMSIFTGTFPSWHGVQNVQFGTDPRTGRDGPIIYPLRPEVPTMAEIFSAAGFTTLGLTDGGNVNKAHGFGRGFGEYTKELVGVERQIADAAERIPQLASQDNRFFLFWHTYQIHAPYVPPAKYRENWVPKTYDGPLTGVVENLDGLTFAEKFGRMRDEFWVDREQFSWPEAAYLHGLYKAGIRSTDQQLTQLFTLLRTYGLLDTSVIVLLSDHGEEFFEHGKWQHEQLYEECLRVPLMVRLPGGLHGGTRIDVPVSLVDVLPTVLDLLEIDTGALDLPGPVQLQGQSLAGAVVGDETLRPRPIVSELRQDSGGLGNTPGEGGGPNYDWMIAIHFNGMKFLHDQYRGKDAEHRDQALFDLTADPAERKNVLAKRTDIAGHFTEQLDLYLAMLSFVEGGSAEIPDMSLEELEKLVALGYLSADQYEQAKRAKEAEAAAGGDGG